MNWQLCELHHVVDSLVLWIWTVNTTRRRTSSRWRQNRCCGVSYLFLVNRCMIHVSTLLRSLFIIIIIINSGVGLSPLGTAATSGLLYKPQMIDEGDFFWAIGGMKIGRRNRSTRRKPAPAPLCPPQIPQDQTRARTRAAVVGSQRLTAWAMARLLRSSSGKFHKAWTKLFEFSCPDIRPHL
jgi:hypothetical protein